MTDPRPGDAFQPGDVLNNTYRIEALLGRGGTSDVYRARSEISGRLVAIKVLKSEFSGNDDYLVLMTREEEIREIRHDAIVRYSENHRTAEGLVYLLMDFIDGPGLDKKLKEGPMAAEDLLVLCKRVGEGLKAAHDRSIVHRDLSPDNIILRDGDPAQAVVIDFGIAKDTNPGAETIVGNEFAGKYAYAAPEQLSGNTDARSDIYSLGALLLANFRGKSPEVGANPMEVVQKKNDPLDTSDVPEPLKTLLDRMTAPDPAQRFQSMSEVLAFLDSGGTEEALGDETIIVAPPKAKPQPTTAVPDPAPSAKTPAKSTGRPTGLIAAAAAVVLIGGAAAAFFAGVFDSGPRFPAVSPYTLDIENLEDLPAMASGFVPDPEMQNALVNRMSALGGDVDVTLATGRIAPSWDADVLQVLEDISVLDHWQLSLDGNLGTITGSTSDADVASTLTALYSETWPGALSGSIEIALTSLFLEAAAVEQVLEQFADCGPLIQVNDPGPVGYGPEDPVLIKGTLSGDASRAGLQDALDDTTDGRTVVIDAEIMNPTLCLVENFLPEAPSSEIGITFRDGATGQENTTGDFRVGENPVIDVIIPDSVYTGYLSVSVLDVSGNVFHLLPNIGRADNSVNTLRGSEIGAVPVRVAYSLDEERPEGGIAFAVDGSSLGKSKILVIHSEAPLFRQMRPTTESAVGYAEALSLRAEEGQGLIRSLDSRILTTSQP
ncbi:Serine/Threonine protein kinase [Sulfitobacter noctilucae]|uniref:serine/threonine protein kinase n=1 Tax=Sulfitobacter noctilucae TaxID=1342302 RepID=UPI00046A30A7|nr:serine/threonine protein kinase [Sulfitobacter noctilucae]KIN70338.1 Serine/Threonine protein kinase [Sulfitobacter noctilucae]